MVRRESKGSREVGCWGKKGRVEDIRQGWRRWSMERYR